MFDEIREAIASEATAEDGGESPTPQSDEQTSAPEATEETTSPAEQPAEQTPAPETAPAETAGPIPFDRHKAILENTRKEAEARYAWVQAHGDEAAIRNKLSILQQAERDPAGFVRQFMAAAGVDPRTLVPQPTPAQDDPRPDPDIALENGQYTYSHAQLQKLLDWQSRQVTNSLHAEIAPLKQKAVVAELSERAQQHAQQQLQRAAGLPGMDDRATRNEIAAYMQSNQQASLHEAWAAVMAPRLQAQVKAAEETAYQKALATLQQKAGAVTTPAPRTGAMTPTHDLSNLSMAEALRQGLELAARGEL